MRKGSPNFLSLIRSNDRRFTRHLTIILNYSNHFFKSWYWLQTQVRGNGDGILSWMEFMIEISYWLESALLRMKFVFGISKNMFPHFINVSIQLSQFRATLDHFGYGIIHFYSYADAYLCTFKISWYARFCINRFL